MKAIRTPRTAVGGAMEGEALGARTPELPRLSRRTVSAVAVALLLGSALSACSGASSKSESDSGAATAGSLKAGTYTFGVEALTSGPAALAGQGFLDGMNFAASEINDSGFLGSGAKIKLNPVDSGGDPAKAIAAINEWAQKDVSGVLFGILTTVAGASKPVLIGRKMPSIVAGSLLPGLPEPPYIYRPQILLDVPYTELVKAYVASAHPKTSVTVVTADNDGMVSDNKVWTKALKDGNVQVLKNINTNTSDTNFSGPAASVASTAPDVVVLSTLGNGSALMIKALRDAGYDGPILTNYGIATKTLIDIAGSALHDVYYSAAFSELSKYPTAEQFVKAYKAAKGKVPDAYVAFGYNTVWYAATALKESGDGSQKGMVKAMADLTTFKSVYGSLKIENGQAVLADPGSAQFLTFDQKNSPTIWLPSNK